MVAVVDKTWHLFSNLFSYYWNSVKKKDFSSRHWNNYLVLNDLNLNWSVTLSSTFSGDFVYITDSAYTQSQIRQMEIEILRVLNFDLVTIL